jgi:Peptidase family M20/M25/M40
VQPAMERDWKTDPFELHSIDGYFYARGASDNKASSSPDSVPSVGNRFPVAAAQWLVC